MAELSLGLIVLRTANLIQTLEFYQALGLNFVEEKHGNSPIHYSCNLGQTVLEIYPGKPGIAPDRKNGGATMLGFQVNSVNETVETLNKIGAKIISSSQNTSLGCRALIEDPDGRAIEINE